MYTLLALLVNVFETLSNTYAMSHIRVRRSIPAQRVGNIYFSQYTVSQYQRYTPCWRHFLHYIVFLFQYTLRKPEDLRCGVTAYLDEGGATKVAETRL